MLKRKAFRAVALLTALGFVASAHADLNIDFTAAQATVANQTITLRNLSVSGVGTFDVDLTYNPKTVAFDYTRVVQTSSIPSSGSGRSCTYSSTIYGGTASVTTTTYPSAGNIVITYSAVSNSYFAFTFNSRFRQGSSTFVLPQWEGSLGDYSKANSATWANGIDYTSESNPQRQAVLTISGIPPWFDLSAEFMSPFGPC